MWKSIKNIIYKILQFLKDAHSSGTNGASCKRLYGGLGMFCCLIFLFIAYYSDYKHKHVINSDILDYAYDVLYVSASLIGLETITNLIKGNKNIVNSNKNIDNCDQPQLLKG